MEQGEQEGRKRIHFAVWTQYCAGLDVSTDCSQKMKAYMQGTAHELAQLQQYMCASSSNKWKQQEELFRSIVFAAVHRQLPENGDYTIAWVQSKDNCG